MAVVAVLATIVLLFSAPPALANHLVSWGVGDPSGPKDATIGEGSTGDDAVVPYEVSVTLDGEPLSGWPMRAEITEQDGSSENIEITTDASGHAAFGIGPVPAEETWVVRLCDDDGCVYGEGRVTGAPAAAPTTEATAPPGSSPEATPSTAIDISDETGGGGGSRTTGVLVLVAGLLVAGLGLGIWFGVGGFGTRVRNPAPTGTRDRGGDEDEPRDAPPPEFIPHVPPAPVQVHDFGIDLATSTNEQGAFLTGKPIRVPAQNAAVLGHYRVVVMSYLDQGSTPAPVSKRATSQREYDALGPIDGWLMTTTVEEALGFGEGARTGVQVVCDDRHADPSTTQFSKFAGTTARPNRTEIALDHRLIDRTVVRITFEPAPGKTCTDHRFAAGAQSSLSLRLKADCRAHRIATARPSDDIHETSLVIQAAIKIVEAGCPASHDARFDVSARVECPDAGIDYNVAEAPPMLVSQGTASELKPEIGLPEIELGVSAGGAGLKAGKLGMSLKSGEHHVVDRALWADTVDRHGERKGLEFAAYLDSDVRATASLKIKGPVYEKYENLLDLRAEANHELWVTATGTVDGHPVAMTLAIGQPSRDRPANSEIRVPHAPGGAAVAGADGVITESRGSHALHRPGTSAKPGGGQKAAVKVLEPQTWQ